MTETKRCCGYKGHWECREDYPDHMVPVEQFNSGITRHDGLQPRCRRCSDYHFTSRPKHPVTRECKHDWKHRVAKSYGGIPKTPDWQSHLDRVEIQWNEEWKSHPLNTAPAKEVITFLGSRKAEFGQSTPMTKRETVKVEGETVLEGWVYVVCNPDVPWTLKIGKTFPDGISDIMSSARRFGRAELVGKFWFEEAYKAEQEVHALLNYCNLRTLGYTDCGRELFKCTIEEAINAITKVQSGNDRPSIAVGE